MDSIKDSISYVLQVVSRLQTVNYLSRIGDFGVHPAEAYALIELWYEEPLSQSELSSRLDIGNASVGQTIKRLERDGFVKRERCLDDGRRVLVSLTKSGRALQKPLSDAGEMLNKEIINELGKKDAEVFLKMLVKLAELFREK